MQNFHELGITYYESKIIDVLLKESLAAKKLSKKSGVPPGKVYSVLQGLRKKGLIEQTLGRPQQYFISDPSHTLAKLMEEKQLRDESLYNQLRRMASDAARARSQPSQFFQFGVTTEENRDIQLRTFTEAKKEICQIINIHHKPQSNRASKSVWEKEIGAAITRGVKFRSIYPEDIALPELLAKLPKEKFQVKRKSTDFARCDVIDGKKAMIKLVSKDALAFGGIIFIEDERFARNLQKVFEQLWEEAR